MRIRSSFLLLILVIGVLLLGALATVINEAHQERQSTVAARGLAATQGEVLRLLELIGIERGAYNAALRSDATMRADDEFLAKPRKVTDTTIAAALANAEASGHPAINTAAIRSVQTGLQEWRRKVEDAIARPLADRPADVMKGYVPALADMVTRLAPVLNAIDAAISHSDSDVANAMVLARLAADMRAEASIRGTTFVNIIAAGKPIPPATRVFIAEQSGKVDAIWARIVMSMGMIDASADLKDKAELTRKAFYGDLQRIMESIFAASEKAEAYPFKDVADFRTQQNPLLYTAGHMRDAAIADALSAADQMIATRTRTMIVQSAIAAVAVLLLAGGIVFFLRRVISPLGAMTGTMTRIANGEQAEIGYAGRRDEIGDMAKALGIFQRNAEEKAALEATQRAQAETESRRMAEQREREAAISREIADFCGAMGDGEFARRIDLAGKDGVFRDLSQQLNGLADTMQAMMADLAHVLGGLAAGDLTRSTTGSYRGGFATLADAARDTTDRLRDFASRLRGSAAAVNEAAGEISAGSQDLASRTESQAASIEETAASMHEITTTVKQNADNAQAANQLASVARDTAEKGGSVVSEAVSAVNRIEESARKISDIVSLIDEIAFQTNLLALNASVEAARAGEAGKGFAVVAQEVRALAQRSANASKDIKALIAESNAQVKTGADLVGRTGSSLEDIVGAVKKVADIVAEIAAASREQATGLD
ncbi:methyl-accepting chemotaxis protein, partial [Ferrovibrio sp.]|uniref:methyl-accepting chemotaxis protein n=1 Tax=Ferrovibrio sp. TaxID=1917215 RepID=UPI00311D7B16